MKELSLEERMQLIEIIMECAEKANSNKVIEFFEQRSDSGQVDSIVKWPLPDVYEGELNTRRIKRYQEISDMYMVSEGTVRDLFNYGIDWYKNIIEEGGT